MATRVVQVQKVADHEIEEKLGHDAMLDAKKATSEEHSQTLVEAFRANRKAVMWSVLISLTIVMEGYDTILIGNLFAFPEFKKKFGVYYPDEDNWVVSAPWQSGLTMASTVGAIFGGLANGYFAQKYGYRWVLIIALGILNLFIFVVFFATGAPVLLVGQILCGLCWGVFATLAPAYASEVCPTNLRGYLTTYVNMCWAIGQLLASGVLRGCLRIEGEMGYRIPFALQWVWPLPLMIICFFAPESPWYLVRKDDIEGAKHSLRRLGGEKTEEQINNQIAMMLHTTRFEAEITKGATYADCFKGSNLRRTEIVCVAFCGQIMSGSSFAYTPTFFFTTAGMDTANAFSLGLGAKGMAFLGVVASWWLITYWGRRSLYLMGITLLFVILLLIGILDVSAGDNALWPSGALCVLWLFIYAATIGPLAFAIISETSSVQLRPLSVVLSRTAYQIINVISQVLSSYMMNPKAWNLQGRTGFFWAATAFIIMVWTFFRLPEVKGRTYEELDILFEDRVSARKFSKTHVDAYATVTPTEVPEKST